MAAAQDMNNDKGSEMAAVQDMNNDKGSEMAAVQDMNNDKDSEAKELSGISIVGNDEAPKSLYIVPWKSSEIGAETSLDMMVNEGDVPVDRDVFRRRLEFYQVSTTK
jgi:hypothetical protein